MRVLGARSYEIAFTRFYAIELLVVIGIIAVLVGILLPVMGKARESANRTACAAQLRDVGNLFQMYLNENKQRVPRVNVMPSMPDLVPGTPSIYEVFDRYTKDGRKGWKCPADRIINSTVDGHDTYFSREGGSYQYNPWFNAFAYDEITGVNKVWRDALKDAEERVRVTPDRLIVFQDFDPFHAKAGAKNSRNYLYADWHVGEAQDRMWFGRRS